MRERRAHITCTGQELQHVARHARFVHQPHGKMGNQRGLLGRLGQHHIARSQSGGHFAGENRQREIPRADGGHRAQRRARGASGFGFIGIIAAEIHRLAHFGNRVLQRFARFAHGEHHQRRRVCFEAVCDFAQDLGTFKRCYRRPRAFHGFGGGHGFAY